MKFLVATGNDHKLEEFRALAKDQSLDFEKASYTIDVTEDGDTFNQNAFIKAKAYHKEFGHVRSATTKVTAAHMTSTFFNCTVTASAEQTPKTPKQSGYSKEWGLAVVL